MILFRRFVVGVDYICAERFERDSWFVQCCATRMSILLAHCSYTIFAHACISLYTCHFEYYQNTKQNHCFHSEPVYTCFSATARFYYLCYTRRVRCRCRWSKPLTRYVAI